MGQFIAGFLFIPYMIGAFALYVWLFADFESGVFPRGMALCGATIIFLFAAFASLTTIK